MIYNNTIMRTFVVLLLIFPLSAIAQEFDETSSKRFSMGLSFAPGITYRSLKYSETNGWISNQRDEEEVPKFGFSTGVNLFFRINSHLTIETGLLYANRGQKKKKQDLEWSSQDSSFPESVVIINSYQFFELPVKANYYFTSGKKLQYYVSGGFSNTVFIQKKTKVKSIYKDGNKRKSTSVDDLGYSAINFFINVGVGMEYHLSRKLSIRIEPAYTRSLNSVVQDDKAKELLYSFQLHGGVKVFFLK
jgi:hypothetical protein